MFYGRGGCFERKADTPPIKLILLWKINKRSRILMETYRNGGANVNFPTHLYLVNGLNPGVSLVV